MQTAVRWRQRRRGQADDSFSCATGSTPLCCCRWSSFLSVRCTHASHTRTCHITCGGTRNIILPSTLLNELVQSSPGCVYTGTLGVGLHAHLCCGRMGADILQNPLSHELYVYSSRITVPLNTRSADTSSSIDGSAMKRVPRLLTMPLLRKPFGGIFLAPLASFDGVWTLSYSGESVHFHIHKHIHGCVVHTV